MKKFSFAFSLLLLVTSAVVAMAQCSATLTGTVTDQTGAVVAGANVTATNIATNVGTTTQTTDSGLYRFPTLPGGAYNVAINATGFKSAQVENVILTVGQTVTRDVKLEVGVATE